VSVRVRVLSIALCAMGSLLLPPAAAAVTRTPFDTNLLKNGGAEAGNASHDGQSSVEIPKWTKSGTGKFTVVKYGTAGFPTLDEAVRIAGREQLFTAGPAVGQQCGFAYQSVAIKGRGKAIDAGNVAAVLRARIGTGGNAADPAVLLKMVLLPKDVLPLTPGREFSTHQTETQGLLEPSEPLSGTLLPGERQIVVFLAMDTTNPNGYCDAYFDKVNLQIVHS
jgi:hypothetical protein